MAAFLSYYYLSIRSEVYVDNGTETKQVGSNPENLQLISSYRFIERTMLLIYCKVTQEPQLLSWVPLDVKKILNFYIHGT